MSGISYLKRITGATNSLVQVDTSDNTATATAANYLTAQLANIAAANDGAWTWETNDLIILSASDGVSFCTINSTFTTLVLYAFSSTVVNPPVVVGDFAVFASTGGNIEDLGYLPSNAAYTNVAMANVPTIANQLAMFNDVDGSITDSGIVVADGGIVPSAANALTAHAGGGQGSALALTHTVNRVTTVASAGDSVKLPTSVAGLSVTIINNGANVMQVFGAGTDTINNVATGTGVPQQPNSVVRYVTAVAGLWQAESLPFGYSAAFGTVSAATGLTAHAGGTQAAGLQLTSAINNVSTVATAGDSVLLPVSAAGMEITITNSGVASMQVYGNGTDTINGVTTTTGVAQLPGQTVVYTCAVAGNWLANLSSNPNPVLFASVPITASAFNGMYAAPVALVAAPGANKLIAVEGMELIMTFGSADYAAGGIVFAQYDSTADGAGVKATNTEAAADFFAAASTTFQFVGTSGNTVGALPFSTTVNKGLYLSNATQPFTTGDSTWVAKIYYRIVSTVGAL